MRRILVADDNAVSRELIREILGSAGYEVLEAADGQETLEVIERTRPELVLLDIQMPVLDGYAVVRQLRSDPRFRGIRVLAITAYAMKQDRERALAAGFDGYIAKPINAAALRKLVDQYCAARAAGA